ncbi:MAG TPA: response regulator [Polyangiales bacterium]|jgi:HD-like signal output (HDOD) protein/CheY-like chemotaxis protein|nr:response regulator [Polyangiales bacterium]
MMRVLFVDDEQQLLDGLRDVLRRQRKRWEMHFVSDGRVALERMQEKPFDAIVTDMRMPGMDGAALLAHIKKHYSATARIILSGEADRDSVMRALPHAHQFLSKPCDPDGLVAMIERVQQLQTRLADANIRNVVGSIEKLPSAPSTYWDLTLAAEKPDTGLSEFAAIVERDPAMSLKVLQLVNSAFFGAARRVNSVQQAVGRLGLELLKALTLSVHAFDTLKAPPCPGFSIDDLQQHSFLTARLAKQLTTDANSGTEAFAACVLHDVGKLVLAVGAPPDLAEVLKQQRETQRPAYELEREKFGTTHAEVGAFLLGSWGLPLTLVETVAYHHMPQCAPGTALDSSRAILAAVHAADALMDRTVYKVSEPGRDNKLDLIFIEQCGLTKELPRWRELAAKVADS